MNCQIHEFDLVMAASCACRGLAFPSGKGLRGRQLEHAEYWHP
jgi:hypothetical protein